MVSFDDIKPNKARRRRRMKMSVMAVFALFCILVPLVSSFGIDEATLEADATSYMSIDRLSDVNDIWTVLTTTLAGTGSAKADETTSATLQGFCEAYTQLATDQGPYFVKFKIFSMQPLSGICLDATSSPQYDSSGASFFIRGLYHADQHFYEATNNSGEYHGGPGIYFNLWRSENGTSDDLTDDNYMISVTIKFVNSANKLGCYASSFYVGSVNESGLKEITICDDTTTNVITVFAGTKQVLSIRLHERKELSGFQGYYGTTTILGGYYWTGLDITDVYGNVRSYGYTPDGTDADAIIQMQPESYDYLIPDIGGSYVGMATRGDYGRITITGFKIDNVTNWKKSVNDMYANVGTKAASPLGQQVLTAGTNAGYSNLLRNQGGIFTFQGGNAHSYGQTNPMMEKNAAGTTGRWYGFRGCNAFYSQFSSSGALPSSVTSYTYYVDVVDGMSKSNDDVIFIRARLPEAGLGYSPLYESSFSSSDQIPGASGIMISLNGGKLYVRIHRAVGREKDSYAVQEIGHRGIGTDTYVFDLDNDTTKVGYIDNGSTVTIFEIVDSVKRVVTKIDISTTAITQTGVVGANFTAIDEDGNTADFSLTTLWTNPVFSSSVTIRKPDGDYVTYDDALVSASISGSIVGIATRGFYSEAASSNVQLRLRSIHLSYLTSGTTSGYIDDYTWLYDTSRDWYYISNDYEMTVFKRVVEAGRSFEDDSEYLGVAVWSGVTNAADTSEVGWDVLSTNFKGLIHSYTTGFESARLENGNLVTMAEEQFTDAVFNSLKVSPNSSIANHTLDMTLNNVTVNQWLIYEGKGDVEINGGSYPIMEIRDGTDRVEFNDGTFNGWVQIIGGDDVVINGGTFLHYITYKLGVSVTFAGDAFAAEGRYFDTMAVDTTTATVSDDWTFSTELTAGWCVSGDMTDLYVAFDKTLPMGTQITLCDVSDTLGNAYYYYSVESDFGQNTFYLSDFKRMGTSDTYFDSRSDAEATDIVLSVDFSRVENTADIVGETFTVTFFVYGGVPDTPPTEYTYGNIYQIQDVAVIGESPAEEEEEGETEGDTETEKQNTEVYEYDANSSFYLEKTEFNVGEPIYTVAFATSLGADVVDYDWLGLVRWDETAGAWATTSARWYYAWQNAGQKIDLAGIEDTGVVTNADGNSIGAGKYLVIMVPDNADLSDVDVASCQSAEITVKDSGAESAYNTSTYVYNSDYSLYVDKTEYANGEPIPILSVSKDSTEKNGDWVGILMWSEIDDNWTNSAARWFYINENTDYDAYSGYNGAYFNILLGIGSGDGSVSAAITPGDYRIVVVPDDYEIDEYRAATGDTYLDALLHIDITVSEDTYEAPEEEDVAIPVIGDTSIWLGNGTGDGGATDATLTISIPSTVIKQGEAWTAVVQDMTGTLDALYADGTGAWIAIIKQFSDGTYEEYRRFTVNGVDGEYDSYNSATNILSGGDAISFDLLTAGSDPKTILGAGNYTVVFVASAETATITKALTLDTTITVGITVYDELSATDAERFNIWVSKKEYDYGESINIVATDLTDGTDSYVALVRVGEDGVCETVPVRSYYINPDLNGVLVDILAAAKADSSSGIVTDVTVGNYVVILLDGDTTLESLILSDGTLNPTYLLRIPISVEVVYEYTPTVVDAAVTEAVDGQITVGQYELDEDRAVVGDLEIALPVGEPIPDTHRVGVYLLIDNASAEIPEYPANMGMTVTVGENVYHSARVDNSWLYVDMGEYSLYKDAGAVSGSFVISGLVEGSYTLSLDLVIVENTAGVNILNRLFSVPAYEINAEVVPAPNRFEVSLSDIDGNTDGRRVMEGTGVSHTATLSLTSDMVGTEIECKVYKQGSELSEYEEITDGVSVSCTYAGDGTGEISVTFDESCEAGVYRIVTRPVGRPDTSSVYTYVYIIDET